MISICKYFKHRGIPVTFCIRSRLDNKTNAVSSVLIQPPFTCDNSNNTRKQKYLGYLSRKVRVCLFFFFFFPENNLKRKLHKNVSKSSSCSPALLAQQRLKDPQKGQQHLSPVTQPQGLSPTSPHRAVASESL